MIILCLLVAYLRLHHVRIEMEDPPGWKRSDSAFGGCEWNPAGTAKTLLNLCFIARRCDEPAIALASLQAVLEIAVRWPRELSVAGIVASCADLYLADSMSGTSSELCDADLIRTTLPKFGRDQTPAAIKRTVPRWAVRHCDVDKVLRNPWAYVDELAGLHFHPGLVPATNPADGIDDEVQSSPPWHAAALRTWAC